MKNKFMYLVLISLISVFLLGCEQAVTVESGAQPTAEKGRVVFAITDAAADMGSVSSVKVTVDSVSVHSAAEEAGLMFHLLQEPMICSS